jgi:hypothetical protein
VLVLSLKISAVQLGRFHQQEDKRRTDWISCASDSALLRVFSVQTKREHKKATPERRLRCQLWTDLFSIGVTGFEPATSCSQSNIAF